MYLTITIHQRVSLVDRHNWLSSLPLSKKAFPLEPTESWDKLLGVHLNSYVANLIFVWYLALKGRHLPAIEVNF